MITNIPFEISRDIAYFELLKELTALKEERASDPSNLKMAAIKPLREYQTRTESIFNYGLESEELEQILEDFKTNPISLQSCKTKEKHSYMIQELETLLSGDYDKDGFVVRLIKAYGYTDKQAKALQETTINGIQSSGKLVSSIYDFLNDYFTDKLSKEEIE